MWQSVSSAGGGWKHSLLEKERLRAAPCQIQMFQPAPMDPLQSTAEPLSSAGGTSRKTYVKKGKKRCAINQSSEANESKTALQTPRPEKKEGKEELQGLGQKFPCIAWRRP